MSNDGDILPASEGMLIYFASYLARTVKHSTIKLYLSADRNLHISCGHGDPVQGKFSLAKGDTGHSLLLGQVSYPLPTRHTRGVCSNPTNSSYMARGAGLHYDMGCLHLSLLCLTPL